MERTEPESNEVAPQGQFPRKPPSRATYIGAAILPLPPEPVSEPKPVEKMDEAETSTEAAASRSEESNG